jgi:hypothetical protein
VTWELDTPVASMLEKTELAEAGCCSELVVECSKLELAEDSALALEDCAEVEAGCSSELRE